MHEMGIAQELVRIALDALPQDLESPRVETLHLKIGKLSSVVEHSLTFCFEIITKDTPLENARLEIEVVPVRIRCTGCGKEWEAENPVFQCADCEQGKIEMLSGREIEIISMELFE